MHAFLDHLPHGVSYPDTNPYILELNRRMPHVQFDRYLPSETVLGQNRDLGVLK